MEEFHLKCLSPVELLPCRRTSAIQQSITPTHCYSKTKVGSQRRLCHKNFITTTKTTLTPSRKEALTSTSALLAATTTATATATATTTVRTLTTIKNTSSITSSLLSGNNKHIPIKLRRRLPPLTSVYEQKQQNRQREQQQQRQHLIRKRRNLWSCLYWRHNLTCIMMTMLFLISIVLSGNTALAAQRESFKQKDANNFDNNANAIYNEISGSSSSGSSSNSIVGGGAGGAGTSMNINTNGNGNDISHSNNNNISNGNTNVTTTTSLSTSTSTSTSSSSAVVSGSGYATTTSTHTTSSTSSLSGSGSGGGSGSSTNFHKTSSSSRNSIELQETTQNGPYFDKAASKNVTALLGKTAYLNCRVKNLGNKTITRTINITNEHTNETEKKGFSYTYRHTTLS